MFAWVKSCAGWFGSHLLGGEEKDEPSSINGNGEALLESDVEAGPLDEPSNPQIIDLESGGLAPEFKTQLEAKIQDRETTRTRINWVKSIYPAAMNTFALYLIFATYVFNDNSSSDGESIKLEANSKSFILGSLLSLLPTAINFFAIKVAGAPARKNLSKLQSLGSRSCAGEARPDSKPGLSPVDSSILPALVGSLDVLEAMLLFGCKPFDFTGSQLAMYIISTTIAAVTNVLAQIKLEKLDEEDKKDVDLILKALEKNKNHAIEVKADVEETRLLVQKEKFAHGMLGLDIINVFLSVFAIAHMLLSMGAFDQVSDPRSKQAYIDSISTVGGGMSALLFYCLGKGMTNGCTGVTYKIMQGLLGPIALLTNRIVRVEGIGSKIGTASGAIVLAGMAGFFEQGHRSLSDKLQQSKMNKVILGAESTCTLQDESGRELPRSLP